MTVKEEQLGEALLQRVAEYLPEAGQSLVREALDFAVESHAGQVRKNGDPVITHPLSAAETVAELHLDAATIAAALLHDVEEDCGVSQRGDRAALRARSRAHGGRRDQARPDLPVRRLTPRPSTRTGAGGEPAQDVPGDGRGHPRRDHQAGRPPAQHAHALGAERARSRRRIAHETMEIYAPLANRLGIWEIKWQLEDLAFRYLEPEKYKQIAEMLEVEARGPRASTSSR